MSRFDNLEFDDTPRNAKREEGPRGSPIRDAAYYQAEADTAFRRWDFECALKGYSRALEDDHKRIACWVGQLRSLVELGEFKEALLWANKATEFFPDHPEVVAMQSVAAARSGMISVALAHSDNALTRQGVTPMVWLARGEVLLAARRRLADHCFTQALALAGDDRAKAWTRVDVARLLLRYKRPAQAVKYAEPAVETLAGEPGAWLVLGICQARLGLRKATESLERALELDSECQAAKLALKQFKPGGLLRRLFGIGSAR